MLLYCIFVQYQSQLRILPWNAPTISFKRVRQTYPLTGPAEGSRSRSPRSGVISTPRPIDSCRCSPSTMRTGVGAHSRSSPLWDRKNNENSGSVGGVCSIGAQRLFAGWLLREPVSSSVSAHAPTSNSPSVTSAARYLPSTSCSERPPSGSSDPVSLRNRQPVKEHARQSARASGGREIQGEPPLEGG